MDNNELDCAKRESEGASEKHKFQKDFRQTYEEAFRWRFEYYISIMKGLAEYFGRDVLIDMIQRAVDESHPKSGSDNPGHTFTDYIESGKKAFENMMTWDIIEESDRAYEIRVTECLWAKTFQERDAADIGYATICYGDFSDARAYHSKLRLERTQTLMQGHECCNHRWTWEA